MLSGKWRPFCYGLNVLRPEQNGCHFTEGIFFCILINMSLRFVPQGPTDNKSAMVQVMVCLPTGDKYFILEMLGVIWYKVAILSK